MSVMPEKTDREQAHVGSRIPGDRFVGLGHYPETWKYWKPRRGLDIVGDMYEGAFGERPVWDVTRWDPRLAFFGILPPTFNSFLRLKDF